MVQVEELLDVSINAEARYANGLTPQSAPSPVGQQRARCLKILLSDGSTVPTSHTTSSSSLPPLPLPLVGVETKPIPILSTNSQPGIKLLLRTPLSIRYGVLLLHEGNTLVLSGNVPALIEVQQKAIQMAEKNSMVNVDPTIRALINRNSNFTFGENDDEEDEWKSTSTDVPVRAPLTAPRPVSVSVAVPAPVPPLPPPTLNSIPPSNIVAPMTTNLNTDVMHANQSTVPATTTISANPYNSNRSSHSSTSQNQTIHSMAANNNNNSNISIHFHTQ